MDSKKISTDDLIVTLNFNCFMNHAKTFIIIGLLYLFSNSYAQIPWNVIKLIEGGRIDAIEYLGNSIVLAGTRNPNPGYIFKSVDFGVSWEKVGDVNSSENGTGITCISAGKNGWCYLLTEQSDFWRSTDYGESWQKITTLSDGKNTEGFALSYSIIVTNKGTILVSDTNSNGGSIYRSTDNGNTFKKIGPVSTRALYRFTMVETGIIVNGWAGKVYKSEDDGLDLVGMGSFGYNSTLCN